MGNTWVPWCWRPLVPDSSIRSPAPTTPPITQTPTLTDASPRRHSVMAPHPKLKYLTASVKLKNLIPSPKSLSSNKEVISVGPIPV